LAAVPHDLLAELDARGLIHDVTDREALARRLSEGPIGIYVGFDPTADSLHVGHLVGQLYLRRFQLAGHRPVALAGGATGMVGDPSGRSEERNLLDLDTLRHNVASIALQLRRLIDFEPGPTQARLVNNADWTEPLGVLDFLRDVGKFVSINTMLTKDSVRSRLEGGLSYTEFSYSLLQANDFRHLFEHEGVELQGGGSDQWGNIVAGVDLVRRRLGATAHAITHPLVTNSDGTKFGKSAAGAVWLDPAKTSPYRFSQFWVQVDDAMAPRYLQMLSMRSLDEIADLTARSAAARERRIAQRALSREMTELVHGGPAADAAEEAAAILFGGDPTTASPEAFALLAGEVPTIERSRESLADTVGVLVGAGLASSNSDARRKLTEGSFKANGVKLDPEASLAEIAPLHERYVLLSRGKKTYGLIRLP
jgi:tyrosyl-tRNA synthetase